MKRWLKYKAAKLVDMGVGVLLPPRDRSDLQLPLLALSRGKFLFVVLDHLGDAILATPAISALKSCFPECSLTVLTRPLNVPVFQNSPHIDHLMTDDAPWWSGRPVSGCLKPSYWKRLYKNISGIRKQQFDVVADLRGDLRHLILFGAAASPKVLLGYGRTGGENLLSIHVPYDASRHEIDKKLALLWAIGIQGAHLGPRIWLLPEEIAKARQFVRDLLGKVDSSLILLDPGAKPIQQWPLDRYAMLARSLRHQFGQPVLVSAGPLYSQLAKELVGRAGENSARFVGNMALRELMALIGVCDLVVSSDTGIAHIASAVGTKTITLFGPTNPARFWHGVEGARIVRATEPCCSEELHETCSKPANPVPGFCMQMISESQVENAVADALSCLHLPESSG